MHLIIGVIIPEGNFLNSEKYAALIPPNVNVMALIATATTCANLWSYLNHLINLI